MDARRRINSGVWTVALMTLVAPMNGARAATPPSTPGFVVQEGPEARVWLDRGAGAVYDRGERARVYYRVSEDAYVAIFHIDTDGRATLAFPRTPHDDSRVRGGRDYRLLFPASPYFRVDEHPGVGYFFIVASREPMSFGDFYRAYDRGWDLSLVGSTVYRDPYVAMDDYVARLIPDWEYAPYALDFVEYNVDRVYDYPRFVCYECHGYRPYTVWNPYHRHCTSFRVVIHSDPYYYPIYRYRGTRVVFVRPPVHRGPRYVFKERAVGEPGVPLRTAPRRVTDPVTVSEPVRRRPSSEGGARTGESVRRPRSTPPASLRPPSRTPDRVTPRPTGAAERGRSGSGRSALPAVRPPSRSGGGTGAAARPSRGQDRSGSAKKPVLLRRPSSGSRPVTRSRPQRSGTRQVRPSTQGRSGSAAASPRRPSRGSVSGVRSSGSSRSGTGARSGSAVGSRSGSRSSSADRSGLRGAPRTRSLTPTHRTPTVRSTPVRPKAVRRTPTRRKKNND